MRKKISVNHIMLAKTWKLFTYWERELTAHELADTLEIAILTSWKWCRALHDQGLIHICDWRQDTLGRYQTPVFAGGDKLDKKKPRKTNIDRRLEYERKKEDRKKARAEKKEQNAQIC